MIFMYNLTVYVTYNCGACSLVLNWLEQNGVIVTEVINVDDDLAELTHLIENGYRQFPVVSLNHFNDVSFGGFQLDKLEEIKEKVGIHD